MRKLSYLFLISLCLIPPGQAGTHFMKVKTETGYRKFTAQDITQIEVQLFSYSGPDKKFNLRGKKVEAFLATIESGSPFVSSGPASISTGKLKIHFKARVPEVERTRRLHIFQETLLNDGEYPTIYYRLNMPVSQFIADLK